MFKLSATERNSNKMMTMTNRERRRIKLNHAKEFEIGIEPRHYHVTFWCALLANPS